MTDKTEMSIRDAFIALDQMDDDDIVVSTPVRKRSRRMNEGKAFNVRSTSEMEKAEEVLNKPKKEVALEVIDTDADAIDHLKNNEDYVGQIILQCNSCKATRFLNPDDLVEDEADSDVYNVNDECPHCHAVGNGYHILGQVGAREEEPEVKLDNDSLTDEVKFDNDMEKEEPEQEEETEEKEEETTETSDEEEDTDLDSELQRIESEDEEEDKEKKESLKEDEESDVDADNCDFKIIIHDANGNKYEIDSVEDINDYDDLDISSITVYDCNGTKNVFATIEEVKSFIRGYHEYNEDFTEKPEETTEENTESTEEETEEEDEEEESPITVKEFIESKFVEPESLTDIIITDLDTDSEKPIFTGEYTEIPQKVLNSEIIGFNVADGKLNIRASKDETEETPKLDCLEYIIKDLYDNDENDQISVVDAESDDEIVSGTKQDVGDKIEGYTVDLFDAPERLVITIRSNEEEPEYLTTTDEEEPDQSEDKESELIEDLIEANDMSLYKTEKYGTNEYWLAESIKMGEDLDIIYEKYVADKSFRLIKEFKEVTGYKTKLDEALEDELVESDNCISETDALSKAQAALKNKPELKAVIYGFTNGGKFNCLEGGEIMEIETDRELNMANELIDRKYRPSGTVRVLYKRSISESLNRIEVPTQEDGWAGTEEQWNLFLDELSDLKNPVHFHIAVAQLFEFVQDVYNNRVEGLENTISDYQKFIKFVLKQLTYVDDTGISYLGLRDIPKALVKELENQGIDLKDFRSNFVGETDDLRRAADNIKAIKATRKAAAKPKRKRTKDYLVVGFDIDDNPQEVEAAFDDYDEALAFAKKLNEEQLREYGDPLPDDAYEYGVIPNNGTIVDIYLDESLNTKDYRNRKELSEAIKECQNNNQPYTIKRSLKEGYRYTLTKLDESSNEDPSLHEYGKEELSSVNLNEETMYDKLLRSSHKKFEKPIEKPVTEEFDDDEDSNPFADLDDDGFRSVPQSAGDVDAGTEISTEVQPEVTSTDIFDPRDHELVDKLVRIAHDTKEAIESTYDVQADERFILADLIQDLRLVSGDLKPEDIERTPLNQLTLEMYDAYDGFYNAMDEMVSFLTGQPYRTTQLQRIEQAVNSLDGQDFTTESIYEKIQSPEFERALTSGGVPGVQLPSTRDSLRLQAPTDNDIDESLNETLTLNDLGQEVHTWDEFLDALADRGVKEQHWFSTHHVGFNGEADPEILTSNPFFDSYIRAGYRIFINGEGENTILSRLDKNGNVEGFSTDDNLVIHDVCLESLDKTKLNESLYGISLMMETLRFIDFLKQNNISFEDVSNGYFEEHPEDFEAYAKACKDYWTNMYLDAKESGERTDKSWVEANPNFLDTAGQFSIDMAKDYIINSHRDDSRGNDAKDMYYKDSSAYNPDRSGFKTPILKK